MDREVAMDLAGDDELVFFEDLDSALIGVVERFESGGHVSVACYDYDKCVKIFQLQGMTYEEAVEWMEFNVTGAYVGEKTPAFLHRGEDQ